MTQTYHIADAIYRLRPGSEFVISGGDLENINWVVLDGDAPTKKQILDEVKVIEAELTAKVAQREALLERLGISDEEARLLLG